jgi:hypothetical protein
MNRREKIKLTLEQIKVVKKLVAEQAEFISLSRAIGYEPIHAPTTLQRFRSQLSERRRALAHLTTSGQKDFAARIEVPQSVRQRAA